SRRRRPGSSATRDVARTRSYSHFQWGGGVGVRTVEVRSGHDGARAGTGDADAAPPRSPPGGSGQLADLVPDRLGVPAEDDVLDRVRVSGGHVAEPQRDRREVLEQDLLRLVGGAERLLGLRWRQRLAQGLRGLGVYVVGVVPPPALRGRGGGKRPQEIEPRGGGGLPTGTEGSLHGPVGDL